MGTTIPWKVGLGGIRKVAEREPESKSVSNVLLWLLLPSLPLKVPALTPALVSLSEKL